MATGNKLTIAPESDKQRMTIENLNGNNLQLLDGRGKYNNGWFVVRSLIQKGKTQHAIEWLVTPHAIDGWIVEAGCAGVAGWLSSITTKNCSDRIRCK